MSDELNLIPIKWDDSKLPELPVLPYSCVEKIYYQYYKQYNTYCRDAEKHLVDLYKKEVDPSFDGMFTEDFVKQTNLSVLQIQRDSDFKYDLKNKKEASCVMYFPLFIGFRNLKTGDVYVMDKYKRQFCIHGNDCIEDCCNCKSFKTYFFNQKIKDNE